MGVFDDILKTVPAEDLAVLNKYPQLKASMDKLESDHATAARFAGEWANWQQTNWDPDAGMTKAEKYLRDQLAEAQGRLESAAAPGSGASAGEIATLKREFDEKLKALADDQQRTISGINTFYGKAATKMLPHQQEFGEIFDPQKLLDYMTQNRIADPDLAYDKMMSARRTEIATAKQKELEAKHLADLEAARQEGYNKRAQEVAMGPSGVLPTDSTGGIAGVTARLDKPAAVSDEIKARVADAKLGDNSLALLGYEMYRRGDFQPQQ